MQEKPVERHLREQSRSRGWLCLKFVSPGRNGVPDRLLVTPHGTVFVECKRPGGRLSRLQREQHRKLRQHGGRVYTVSTFTEVDELLDFLHANATLHDGGDHSASPTHAAPATSS